MFSEVCEFVERISVSVVESSNLDSEDKDT